LARKIGLFWLVLAGATLSSPALAEIGRVKSSVGQVQIQRGNTQLPVRPGLQLEQGDYITTGKNGRLGIAFIDDTRFAVGPNAKLRLSKFGYDRTRQTGEFVTEVDRGSLGVVSGKIAKSKQDAMKVRTPTAMLGVRGTKFILDIR